MRLPQLFSVLLAASFAAAPAFAGDYDIIRTWTFQQGDGYSYVGAETLCGLSGYPGTLLRMIDTYGDEIEPAYLGDRHAVLRVPSTGDAVLINLYRESGEDCGQGVWAIELADGERWFTGRTTAGLPVEQSYPDQGTRYADRMYGTDAYGDALYGMEGRDTLYGYDGHDVLDGGAGNDVLYGYEGNDFLFGGAGDDSLYGDEGDDTYLFTGDFGRDVIDDYEGGIRIVLPDALTSELTFRREGYDLIISRNAGASTIRVRDLYDGYAYLIDIRARDGRWDGDPLAVAP